MSGYPAWQLSQQQWRSDWNSSSSGRNEYYLGGIIASAPLYLRTLWRYTNAVIIIIIIITAAAGPPYNVNKISL